MESSAEKLQKYDKVSHFHLVQARPSGGPWRRGLFCKVILFCFHCWPPVFLPGSLLPPHPPRAHSWPLYFCGFSSSSCTLQSFLSFMVQRPDRLLLGREPVLRVREDRQLSPRGVLLALRREGRAARGQVHINQVFASKQDECETPLLSALCQTCVRGQGCLAWMTDRRPFPEPGRAYAAAERGGSASAQDGRTRSGRRGGRAGRSQRDRWEPGPGGAALPVGGRPAGRSRAERTPARLPARTPGQQADWLRVRGPPAEMGRFLPLQMWVVPEWRARTGAPAGSLSLGRSGHRTVTADASGCCSGGSLLEVWAAIAPPAGSTHVIVSQEFEMASHLYLHVSGFLCYPGCAVLCPQNIIPLRRHPQDWPGCPDSRHQSSWAPAAGTVLGAGGGLAWAPLGLRPRLRGARPDVTQVAWCVRPPAGVNGECSLLRGVMPSLGSVDPRKLGAPQGLGVVPRPVGGDPPPHLPCCFRVRGRRERRAWLRDRDSWVSVSLRRHAVLGRGLGNPPFPRLWRWE